MVVLTIDPDDCDAVVFDMDGVLTDTARVHAAAWKDTFDAYLRARAEAHGERFEPFDLERDYPRHVDGKARYDGVRSFLASRGIEIAAGEPSDAPDRETVCGLGNRKNERFLVRLREQGAAPFADGVELVSRLRAAGIRTAVISASRNAREVLERAGIAERFETRIDGVVAAERGLEGKPAPAVLLEAALRLGAEPQRCAIIEDAIAGVKAGRRGGFGWVIGVARHGRAERLVEAGADVVVRDLSEIAVEPADRGQPIERLPSALERLEEIVRRIGDREVVLFLDFDGTLAPIVDRPEAAALPEETATVLAELAGRRAIAIVSGRDLDDVRERVGQGGLTYAGSHGFHLAGPGGLRREHGEAHRFLSALDEAERRLRARLASVEGVQVERKRYAVAVHHRRAGESAAAAALRAVAEVERAVPGLRVGEGRKVRELRPALDWDKGKAIGWLLETLGIEASRACPIYIGDDVTDEDAFRAIEEDGVTIVVRGRRGRTRARYALESPAAVRDFLVRLDEALETR